MNIGLPFSAIVALLGAFGYVSLEAGQVSSQGHWREVRAECAKAMQSYYSALATRDPLDPLSSMPEHPAYTFSSEFWREASAATGPQRIHILLELVELESGAYPPMGKQGYMEKALEALLEECSDFCQLGSLVPSARQLATVAPKGLVVDILRKTLESCRNDDVQRKTLAALVEIYLSWDSGSPEDLAALEEGRDLAESLARRFPRSAEADLARQYLYELENLQVGRQVPDRCFVDLDGEVGSLSALRGRVVVVEFWNRWCLPCIRRIEPLNELQRRYADSLVVLGVVRDNNALKAAEAVEKFGVDWRNVFDRGDVWSTEWNVQRWPRTFVIDRRGALVAKDGSMQDLAAALERLLSRGHGQNAEAR